MRLVILFTGLFLICFSDQMMSQIVDSTKQEAALSDSVLIDSSQLSPTEENLPDSAMSLPVDFFAVEVKPELVGGVSALVKFINTHDLYPEKARSAGINGDIIVQFVVGANGIPKNFKVIQERPSGLGFAEAAMKALRNMEFKPGMQKGEYVEVIMQQVINFRIK